MNVRMTLGSVHRWVGLTLGVLLVISGVTGAGMAYRRDLDPMVYRGEFHASACAAPKPLDDLIAAARQAHPKGAVDFIRLRRAADAPAQVRFGDKDTLYIDRCTGAVTANQNRYQGVFGALEWLHRMVAVPNGGGVMGFGALAGLLIAAMLGVYLWWPRPPRRFSQGFVLDRRLKGPLFTLGLHKTVGGYAAVMLAISAATALPNAFDGLKAMMVGAEAKPQSTPPPGHAGRAPVEAAYAAIRALTPDPNEVLIHLARKPKDAIEAYIIEKGAPHANARSYLYLDAYSDRVLKFAPYRASGWGSRLYYWMLSIHTGEVGGLVGRTLLFLGALSLPVLGYTGASSYLRRRFRRPSLARSRVTAPGGRPA